MKRWLKQWVLIPGMLSTLLVLSASMDGQGQTNARPGLMLSLDDAISLALQNNLEISIEQFNPEIRKEAITAAEAVFDHTSTADLTQTFNESDSTQAPTGITTFNTGIGKKFKSGGSYSLDFVQSGTMYDGAISNLTVDPETGLPVTITKDLENDFDSSLALTFGHALLRNFGADVNTTGIEIARKNRELSVSELRSKIITVVTNVKDAYWQLVNALGDLEAKKISLQLAYDLVKINEAQVDVGTLAPIEVLQAKAQAASRQVAVTTAELTVLNAEDALKQLLNFPENDPAWQSAISPTNAPNETRLGMSLDESIRMALDNREELKKLQTQIAMGELSLNYAENQLKPEFNALGKLELAGNDTAIGDAVGNLAGADNLGVTVGASFSYPLGNRAARSAYNQAKLELDQARLSNQNVEQVIAVDVRIALRRVEMTYDLIGVTRIARQLAQEQLDAEQKKFNEGLSTNFQVLDYQDKLTQAKTQEALAVTGYNQALAQFDKAIGVTLQRHNIVVKE